MKTEIWNEDTIDIFDVDGHPFVTITGGKGEGVVCLHWCNFGRVRSCCSCLNTDMKCYICEVR